LYGNPAVIFHTLSYFFPVLILCPFAGDREQVPGERPLCDMHRYPDNFTVEQFMQELQNA
jgi:hypothetical protein